MDIDDWAKHSTRTMTLQMIARRKTTIALFGIGFLAGFLLEVAVVERGHIADLYNTLLTLSGFRDHKLACVILVKSATSDNLAAAQATWLPRCDEALAIRVNRNRGRDPHEPDTCDRTGVANITATSAWSGLCRILHRLRRSSADWFILSPDNLLVVVENLRRFVRDLNPRDGHYYGHAIGHFDANYNAISAGVVISSGSLAGLLEMFPTVEDCDGSGKYWRNEDVYLGKYLKRLNILPKDTRDENRRGRFHGYNINVLLSPGKLFRQSDYSRKALYPVSTGLNCCSPHLITIDATNSHRLYHHFYYIYQLKLNSGAESGTPARDIPKKDGSFDWREFLRGEGYNETAIHSMTDEEYYQIWARKMPPESLYEMMRRDFASLP